LLRYYRLPFNDPTIRSAGGRLGLAGGPEPAPTFDKLAARTAARNPFVDPKACRAYAAAAGTRFAARLASEQAQ
jgi:hypothetical protein